MSSTTTDASKTGPAYNTRARQPIMRSARELYAEGEVLESRANKPKPSSSSAQAAPTQHHVAQVNQEPSLDEIKTMMINWIDACDKATAANKREDRPPTADLSIAARYLLEATGFVETGASRQGGARPELAEHLRRPVPGIVEAVQEVWERYYLDVCTWAPAQDLGTAELKEKVMNWNTGLKIRLPHWNTTPPNLRLEDEV
ncbi:hypothetical protein H2201_000022 [Coniosporium apollinis]|uniref:Uncharacterized protein n=1 Tax=Coniosporium apollinis TaxID=61459 RepID=A0ABQ9P4Y2_9PEZI|nr:hypothetical protein H2201_000022 [Coniosporium apollinis]